MDNPPIQRPGTQDTQWDTLMMVLSTIFCFLLVFLATPALILVIARSLF